MSSVKIAFKDMTQAQRDAAFEKFMEEKGTRAELLKTKKKALSQLVENHKEEYDELVKQFS